MSTYRVMVFRLLIFAFAFQFAGFAGAEYQYVRQGAAGDGSDWSNALPQLPSVLSRGFTYFIAGGSYPGYAFDDAVSGSATITICKASAEFHGTNSGWAASYGDESAVFTGGLTFISGYYLLNGQTGGGPGAWNKGHGIRVAPPAGEKFGIALKGGAAKYVTIEHVEIDMSSASPTELAGKADAIYSVSDNDSLTLRQCWMHDAGRCLILDRSSDNWLVEYCLFENSGTWASPSNHSEIISAFSDIADQVTDPNKSWVIRYNIFSRWRSTGGIIFTGDGWRIYGNVFEFPAGFESSCGNGVIGTWTQKTTWSDGFNKNHFIYNNTFVNIVGTMSEADIYPGSQVCTNTQIRNNLWYNCPTVKSLGGIDGQHSHNSFFNCPRAFVISEAGMQNETGNPLNQLSPLEYHLNRPTAPGVDLGAMYNDMLGVVRGMDGCLDRGAYEYRDMVLPPPQRLRTITK